MGFQCGIVGLPNVGKSTLFNALLNTAAAEAANYPFCTIEPNVGKVAVPDARLDQIAEIGKSAVKIPAQLEFVDIAGLVRGAATGAGLGNQFLSHIREVDAIVHVLRCFEDDDIVHVEGRVDPLADAEIIDTELALADLESVEKRIPNLQKKVKGGDKTLAAQLALLERVLPLLQEGKPARVMTLAPEERETFRQLQLLTSKPVMFVCNVEESSAATGNSRSAAIEEMAKKIGAIAVPVSAKIESEVAALESDEEKAEFLADLGLSETGLARVIRAGYQLLDLMTYFTVGPKEARAWTITRGMTAQQSAGVIHTDFARGFIAAETVGFEDFIRFGGEQKAKEAGKVRIEGKEYIVKDGDIFHFRFNV